MKHYDVLFIDLDNTLYDFSANSMAAYREVYALLDYNRWFDNFEQYFSIYEEYNVQLWKRYAAGEITKSYLNSERYTHPLRVRNVPDAEILGMRFWDEAMLRLPLGKLLMPHAHEVLDYLCSRYRLYILSNGFTELQSRKMQSAGIAHYFEGVVLSENIGVNKPHPEIFEYALQVAGVGTDKAVMIGDNYDVDIQGAFNVGMDQVFYNVNKDVIEVGQMQPTYMIYSLLELKNLL